MGNELERVLLGLQQSYPHLITEIRGRGLLRAIVLNSNLVAANASRVLLSRGLITVPSGHNSLRLLPPYIMDNSHIARFADILSGFLNDVTAGT